MTRNEKRTATENVLFPCEFNFREPIFCLQAQAFSAPRHRNCAIDDKLFFNTRQLQHL